MSNRYQEISELKARVQKVEEQHVQRKRQHELDHSLWRLDDYVLEELKHNTRLKREDYPSVTSNAPKTLSRATMAMLNKNRPRLRITLPPDVSQQEEDVINANERLVEGSLYDNDLIRGRRGDLPLQEEATWYIAHRGGVILRTLVDPDGVQTFARHTAFDPYECAWDEGDDGLLFFTRHYIEDRASVMDRWNFAEYEAPEACNSRGQVEVWDCWWVEKGNDPETDDNTSGDNENEIYDANAKPRIYNAVLVGNRWAKEPTHHKQFDHIPLYVIRAGGSPARMSQMAGESQERWRADQWESIYSGVRQTIGWLNRAATLYSLYLRDGAIGPWVYKGTRNKNIGAPKAFTTIRIAPGEEFGPVGMPAMANEAKEFLAFIQNEWQKAGVSEIVFGNVPFTVSGFGMLQLRGAVEVLIGSFIRATENFYVFLTHELTEQFAGLGGRKKFNIRGVDRRGKTFMDRIKPSDITKQYIPTVTLKDGLPDDPVAKGNAAMLWAQAGVPRQKIFEVIFDADDAGEWTRQKEREDMEMLPQVKLMRGVKALLEAGEVEGAKMVLQMAIGQGQQGQQQPGAGANEPNPSGPSPDQLPPEVAKPGSTEQGGNFGGGGRPPTRGA